MFSGFRDETIRFFLDIRFHNDKSFMDAHRDEYVRKVRTPFFDLIEALAPTMLKIDPEFETRPQKCLSRLNRDTRFSKDKSPYRDHLWIAFRKAAMPKDGLPFFWYELRPENTTWGLGIWSENRAASDILRRRIAARPSDYEKLLSLAQARGFRLYGAEFKRLEIPPGVPDALKSFYMKKEFYFQKDGEMSLAFSRELADRVAEDFQAIAPLYAAIRGCVDEAMNALE